MENISIIIDGLKTIVAFCLLAGGLGLCLLLIVGAVLRWLAPAKTRAGRLDWLACFAAAILGFVGLITVVWRALSSAFVSGEASGDQIAEAAVFNLETFADLFSLMIKLLLLGSVMASAVVLALVIVLFLGQGLKAILTAGFRETASLKEELKDISNRLAVIMKSPILIAVITWGILALFVTLPFLMGNPEKESMTEVWKSGVVEIVSFGNTPVSDSSDQDTKGSESSNSEQSTFDRAEDSAETKDSGEQREEKTFFQHLIKYILMAVIVLGVSFAVFRLLYSIIFRTFTMERAYDLIDEYSGAIGVLSVGVAMLWTLQNNDAVLEKPSRLALKFLESFAVVLVIVALIILTLEVIRLILDMREKLIRQEARFVFVALVGQVSLLLLSAMTAVYDALNHAMRNPNNRSLERVLRMIEEKIVLTMEKHLSGPPEYRRIFSGFRETISKFDSKGEY